MTVQIHPSAIVDPKAQIGQNVSVGPFTIIGPDVTLHDNVLVKSHVVIEGITSIGENTEVHPFTLLGCAPPDRKYAGEPSRLVIGKNNIIREHVTMHTGTAFDRMETTVGDGCLFMANTHVAHDCIVGNNVIMANNSGLAGHVVLGDNVIVGGLAGVLQRVRIGEGAIIGFLSAVESDVIPFAVVRGERAFLDGVNIIGLERRGMKREDVMTLQKAYKHIFLGEEGTFAERVASLKDSNIEQIQTMISFITERNNRPLCKPAQ